MSGHRNDGGPAFPIKGYCADASGALCGEIMNAPGMSLRAYFMAHAPAEPQPWFQPVMPPGPDFPIPEVELSGEHQRQYRAVIFDEMEPEDADIEVRAFRERSAQASLANKRWCAEESKQRYVQWPAAWADAQIAVLAAREQVPA